MTNAIETIAEVHTVSVSCPECKLVSQLNAGTWAINAGAAFSPDLWYAFTCQCGRDIEFMLPQPKQN